MSKVNPTRSLPEPILPEHQLIRDSAPIPELSAGFRQSVLQECGLSISEASRLRRWKATGAIGLACCLGLAICLILPQSPRDSSTAGNDSATEREGYHSSGPLGFPSSPGVAVDMPKPKSDQDPERSQMNQIIESLNDRQRMFDANMLGL